ncbi:transposable element Tc3 transposase [Trichonephila clavipes]|nr:transposable element Tc3 transposase [Trichonephila clavipes]
MANNQPVRRHLDAFTRGRIIGKLDESLSVTSVAADFGIAHSIVSRLWRQFQTKGTATGGSVVVVHEEPHPQMTGTLSYRPEETGGRRREKSLDTRNRRLDDRYRVLPWSKDCTVVVCLHNALYDESRFSLSSDSHRILIWRERGSSNHPSNIIERDRYGGRGVLFWGGIMFGSRTNLHIFDAGSVNGTRYCNEILLPYVRLFRGAMGLQFLFMDDNTPCHHTVDAEQLLESEDIERMHWPARSPDLNPIEHVWDFLGRCLAARTVPPVTIRELRLALQDEWTAMPQQLIHTLILSMGSRCETCLSEVLGPVDSRDVIYTKTGSWRPRQTSHQEDSRISRNARVQPIVSAVNIQAQAALSLGAFVTFRTIQRRLALGHLGSRRPLRVLPFTPVLCVMTRTRKLDCSGDENRIHKLSPHGECLNPAFALKRHYALTAGVSMPTIHGQP